MELLKKLSPEILVLLCSGSLIVVWILIKNFFHRVMDIVMKIHQKLDYVIIEQQSTDYALNESFKNGYSTAKEEKREELLKRYEFEHTLKMNL